MIPDASYDVFNSAGVLKPKQDTDDRFPFSLLEVGDYFDVPLYIRQTAQNCANTFNKRNRGLIKITSHKAELIARCQRVS